jgi:hypothetical protein
MIGAARIAVAMRALPCRAVGFILDLVEIAVMAIVLVALAVVKSWRWLARRVPASDRVAIELGLLLGLTLVAELLAASHATVAHLP